MQKLKIAMAVTGIALVGAFANADMMKLQPGPNSINGVNVSTSATATVTDTNKATSTYDLKTEGAGLRQKQVVFNIPVYVAQLMVMAADSSRFQKTANGALASLDQISSVAIRLSFLRDVDAPTVATSFQDGLDANKVSAKDPDIVQFMSIVNKNGDVKNTGTLTVFITKNADGSETLAYENLKPGTPANPSVMKGAKGLTHKILSIWLGNSADPGLADLKTQLLK